MRVQAKYIKSQIFETSTGRTEGAIQLKRFVSSVTEQTERVLERILVLVGQEDVLFGLASKVLNLVGVFSVVVPRLSADNSLLGCCQDTDCSFCFFSRLSSVKSWRSLFIERS